MAKGAAGRFSPPVAECLIRQRWHRLASSLAALLLLSLATSGFTHAASLSGVVAAGSPHPQVRAHVGAPAPDASLPGMQPVVGAGCKRYPGGILGEAVLGRAATSPVPRGQAPQERALAKGMFLVASRDLKDPNFTQTVVLLIAYDPGGAMGLVINRPTNLALSSVLPAMEELQERTDTVYIGGPVAQDRIVLLMRTDDRLDQAEHVFGDIYVSGSRSALRQMLAKAEPQEDFHAFVGYAGWAPGQLEGEVRRGDWLLSTADADTVFKKEASEVWPELLRENSGLWVRDGYSPIQYLAVGLSRNAVTPK